MTGSRGHLRIRAREEDHLTKGKKKMAHQLDHSTRTGKIRMGSTKTEWHHEETAHTIWSQPPTVEQVITDIDASTPIEIRPLFDKDGKELEEIRETWRGSYGPNGEKILDENGKHLGRRLGLVGPDYEVVQDVDFVRWFEPWIEAGLVELQSFGAIMGGSRIFGLARLKTEDPVEIQPGDPVAAYVATYNGHDQKIAFKAGPTNIRVVCANTVAMFMKDKTFKKFSTKHRGNMKVKLEDMRASVAEAHGMFLSQCERFKVLAQNNVKDAATLKLYFQKILGAKTDENEVSEVEADDSRNLVRRLVGLYENGQGNKGKTWWDAYNAFTQFATHMRGHTADARLDKMFSGTTAQQNLLALGFGLAAIKGSDLGQVTPAEAKKMAA